MMDRITWDKTIGKLKRRGRKGRLVLMPKTLFGGDAELVRIYSDLSMFYGRRVKK